MSQNFSYDKFAVAQAFGKAAATYDQHAAFQRDVGQLLMARLPRDLTGWRILDVGCGTGYFSYLLAERGAQVVAVDLSHAMLDVCRARCQGLAVEYWQADAEALPFCEQSFDLIFSNLALQWCDDLEGLLVKLARLLNLDGRLLWSTLLEGSLFELQAAWREVDCQQPRVNSFHCWSDLNAMLNNSMLYNSMFNNSMEKNQPSLNGQLQSMAMTYWYPSALALMKDLKGIGATHGSKARGLTKASTLQAVEKAYQRTFRAPDGLLPATYQVCLAEMALGEVNLGESADE